MMTLYHCTGTRSFRALWLLEELEVAYDLRLLVYPPRWTDAYLSETRLGRCLFFIDGPVALTECVAICLYLHRSFLARGSPMHRMNRTMPRGRTAAFLRKMASLSRWPR
jgi:glutathione S-transferase